MSKRAIPKSARARTAHYLNLRADGHFAHLFVGFKIKPAEPRRLPIPKRPEGGIYG